MFLLRVLGFPFAVVYDLVTRIRNSLYDKGLKPSVEFDIPVISVGNLSVGGTGKTPMVEYLVRLFTPQFKLATLSRGYGRRTKGFRVVDESDNAVTIGDEPFQFYKKFRRHLLVAVGEERAMAIPNILQEFPDVQIILLDDAFQHRQVRPSVHVLLTNYHRLFFNDYVLPAGSLRESKSAAARADVVVVTKCPEELSDEEMIVLEKKIRVYANKPVFFTGIRYGVPVAFGKEDQQPSENVILITGIADASPLVQYIQRRFKMVKHLRYPDHYAYALSDVEEMRQLAEEYPNAMLLTTEKDMVKLDRPEWSATIKALPLFYLPIEISFIKNREDFDALMQSVVRDYTS